MANNVLLPPGSLAVHARVVPFSLQVNSDLYIFGETVKDYIARIGAPVPPLSTENGQSPRTPTFVIPAKFVVPAKAHPPSFPRKRESRNFHETPGVSSVRANPMAPRMSVSRRIPFRRSGKVDSRFRGNDEVGFSGNDNGRAGIDQRGDFI